MGYFVRQNYEIRNVGHPAHSRAEDQHTSLLGLGIENYPVLGICVCSFP